MRRLKIGVMGCADIACRSVIPAIQLIANFELVAVSSRSMATAKEFADLFNCEAIEGYQNILDREDIDIIYMPLPTGLHEEWVTKAIEAHKHVLVEKTFALNYVSAQKMVTRAKKNNLLLMENFMFLYHGQHQFVKMILANGDIGDIRCFRATFGFPPLAEDNFRYNKKLGGGALLDAAAYTIRVSQLFLGDTLRVEAATLNYNDCEVDIYGGAYLKNKTGQFSEIAFGFDNFYQCNYEIIGSKGKIVVERAFTPGADMKPTITLEQNNKMTIHQLPAENHFVNILNEFARCLFENDFNDKYIEILNQSRLLQEVEQKGAIV